jgi:hypothetical protein
MRRRCLEHADDKSSRAAVTGDHASASVKTSTGRGPADQSGTYTLHALDRAAPRQRQDRAHLFAISSDTDHIFVRFGGDTMPRKS